MNEAWVTARERLRAELGWIRTHAWLDDLRLAGEEGGAPVLEASPPAARQAEAHREALGRALGHALGRSGVAVRLVVTGARPAAGARPPARAEPGEEVLLETDRLNDRHQLASFLAGPVTEVPLRFAKATVDAPGEWNPLVFYGGPGSGKTHLLQGIGNEYARRYPGRRVVYASSERFARQQTLTARRRQGKRFRDLYRGADLLLLDDVQDLAGKVNTERELAFTLDHLQAARRQIVVTSSRQPRQIAHLEPSLEGRLTGGLVLELKDADRPTRRAIVRARCAACRLDLEEAVVDLLVTRCSAGTRDLLAALTRLEAYQRHVSARLDAPTVLGALSDLLGRERTPATLETIAELVSKRLSVPVEHLRRRTRRPTVVRARAVAMALSRTLLGLTLKEVGAYYGRLSCAAVHAAQRRVEQLVADDPGVREVWDAAHNQLAVRPEAR